MKRAELLAVVFAVALTIVALMPFYVERTMTHVMFAHGSGGTVEWGWKRCTLRDYVSDYPHMDREQQPALWLKVNIGLALSYATLITLPLHFTRRASLG
jgi:hypothetical protein